MLDTMKRLSNRRQTLPSHSRHFALTGANRSRAVLRPACRRIALTIAATLALHSSAHALAAAPASVEKSCTLRRNLAGTSQARGGGRRLTFAAGLQVRVVGRSGDSVHLVADDGLHGWLEARALGQACSSPAAELRALQDLPLEPLPLAPPAPAQTSVAPAPPPMPLPQPGSLTPAPAPASAMPYPSVAPSPEPTVGRLALARWVTLGLGAGLGVGSLTLLTLTQLRGHSLSRDIQAYNGQVAAAHTGDQSSALTPQALESTNVDLHERQRHLQTLDTATWACGIGAAVFLAGSGVLWWVNSRQSTTPRARVQLRLVAGRRRAGGQVLAAPQPLPGVHPGQRQVGVAGGVVAPGDGAASSRQAQGVPRAEVELEGGL